MQLPDTGATQNTKVCNDSGSTNGVECRCRPCTYAIVKRTTEERMVSSAGAAGPGRSWSQVLALAITQGAGVVSWDQDTADLDTPDRKGSVAQRRTTVLPGQYLIVRATPRAACRDYNQNRGADIARESSIAIMCVSIHERGCTRAVTHQPGDYATPG